MKQSTELFVAGFKTLNGFKLAMKDKKIDVNDLQHLFPIVFSWQEGVKDLHFAQEARAATPELIDKAFKEAEAELTAFSVEMRYAIVTSAKGYYTTYWMASRDSFDAGQRAILAELEAHGADEVLLKYRAA